MTLPVLFTAGTGAYNIQRSLRFRSSASAYLNRTFGTSTNDKIFTWSGWVKRGSLGTNGAARQALFASGNSAGVSILSFLTTDALDCGIGDGTSTFSATTSQLFRDPSAWYHIVWTVDTTQATAANRNKVYINGVQVSAYSSTSYPSQNTNTQFSANNNSIARLQVGTQFYFDGYLAEVNFIDGQALTPSSFGQTNSATGVWQPIKYSGTYGTNGFYLNFSDNSNNTATTIGKDYSGNGNNWTPNNISVTSGATYDSMTDVPTLTSATAANYCVLNPLDKNASSITISNGNLQYATSSTNFGVRATVAVSSGKWYWEANITTKTNEILIGIANAAWGLTYVGSTSESYGYAASGLKYNNAAAVAYGASYTTNDVIGIAYDADAGTLTFYKNNVSQGTAYSGLSGTFFPACSGQTSDTVNMNFGQRPFSYTPPTGFKALNTFNLPTPTIGAISSSLANKYFDAITYAGNGLAISSGGMVISSLNFQPDFVWIKDRTSPYSHNLSDVIRGPSTRVYSNLTNAEDTNTESVNTFNSNGFTVGNNVGVNTNGNGYAAWNWKANGAGSTNTAGSITSTVSANTTAGFSIVTYTGTGSNATVGHGLGVAPSMIIARGRSAGTAGFNWRVYHGSLAATAYLEINLTSAQQTDATVWNSTAPTSSVFSLGSSGNVNGSTQTYVAYCFAQVAGYSAFGSYTGNGSSDGPFIFTGFRPRYVMAKVSSTTGPWNIFDSARGTYNVNTPDLWANSSNAETGNNIDFLSNGFKVRDGGGDMNGSGSTYIYMAFAENPFKYSLAR